MGKVTAIISVEALLAPIIALATIVPGIGNEAALPYSVVFGLLAHGVVD